MADFSNSALASRLTISDLEDPICRARNSAKVVEVMLDLLLASRHPQAFSGPGVSALLVDDEDRAATLHAIAELRETLRNLSSTWEAAFVTHIKKAS